MGLVESPPINVMASTSTSFHKMDFAAPPRPLEAEDNEDTLNTHLRLCTDTLYRLLLHTKAHSPWGQ